MVLYLPRQPRSPFLDALTIDRSHMDAHTSCIHPETPADILEFEHFPRINNYVLSVHLNMGIVLPYIVAASSNLEYMPNRIKAVKIHINNGPRSGINSTCLIFDTGHMIITGARTPHMAMLAAHHYRLFFAQVQQPVYVSPSVATDVPPGGPQLDGKTPVEHIGNWLYGTGDSNDYYMDLRPIGHRIKYNSIEIVNIVSNGIISHHTLDLTRFYKAHPEISNYNPEVFPGMHMDVRIEDCPQLSRTCKVVIFDSGKCVILGTRNRPDNLAVHRYMVNLVRNYVNLDRPLDATGKYAYRLKEFLKPTPQEALYDISYDPMRAVPDSPQAAPSPIVPRHALTQSGADTDTDTPSMPPPSAPPSRKRKRATSGIPRYAAMAANTTLADVTTPRSTTITPKYTSQELASWLHTDVHTMEATTSMTSTTDLMPEGSFVSTILTSAELDDTLRQLELDVDMDFMTFSLLDDGDFF